MKIRNRICSSLMILSFVLNLVACQQKQSESTQERIQLELSESAARLPELAEKAVNSDRVIEADTEKEADKTLDECDLSFSALSDLEFYFGSGAGAWETRIEIKPDGSFSGYYVDSNMGEIGEDYPNGTRYECFFSGRFSSLRKVNEYEYTMKCESLLEEGTIGKSEIIEGVKVITAEAYGFEQADEFILYLPDKKVCGLPENFLIWVGINPDSLKSEPADNEIEDRLIFYGLYNVGGQTGFKAYRKNEQEIVDFEAASLVGEYVDDNNDVSLMIIPEGAGYHIKISIFRLTYMDDGIGTLVEDKIIFTATDASGAPIKGEIIETVKGADVTFTDSTWDYIDNGDRFSYYR